MKSARKFFQTASAEPSSVASQDGAPCTARHAASFDRTPLHPRLSAAPRNGRFATLPAACRARKAQKWTMPLSWRPPSGT